MKIIILCLIFFGLILSSQNNLDQFRKSTPKPLISPPPYLQYYTIGYSEFLSDILWMRAIQDFDYCEDKMNKGIKDNTVACVGNQWLYDMLDTITNLSPHFRMPYAVGGVALEFLVGDSKGAAKFYDKAVQNFPKDWTILYKAAHFAMAVEKNNPKAAELLKQSAQNGGGDWFYSLAAKLYSEAGQRELSILTYKEAEKSGLLDEHMLNHMKKRLKISDEELKKAAVE